MMQRKALIRSSAVGGGGFSLVELMIAVGILGVGLIFSMALFTTAVKENASSANNAIGPIICKNALAMARVRLKNGDIGTIFGVIPANKLGPADLAYPIQTTPGSPSPIRGSVALGKRLKDDAGGKLINDYLLVFVAYKKTEAKHSVEARRLPLSSVVLANRASFNLVPMVTWLQIGSPVIASSGKYAWVIAISGTTVHLDRPIDETADAVALFVVVELDSQGAVFGKISPAISVMGSRTGLQH